MAVVYTIDKWIGTDGNRFIYSHALNRKLSPEEHSHEFYEIIYLFSGSADHRINGQVYHLESGDITFLRPGDVHLFINQDDTLELFSISAVPDEVESFVSAYNLANRLLSVDKPAVFHLEYAQMRTLLQHFHRLGLLPNRSERDALIRIILGITMQQYLLQTLEQDLNWIESILYHMREPENMVEGVPAMMRLANLSRAQLCRTLKKMNLQPPKVYVKELRLSKAYELIQNTSMSFEEISTTIGYASVSHFSSAFKSRYGISPGALRRKNMASLL